MHPAISLLGLALDLSVLCLLIIAKEHEGDASIIGGILGLLPVHQVRGSLIGVRLNMSRGKAVRAGPAVG